MKKIFLLFGSNGNLGKNAVKYFLEKNYDQYYFFARNNFEIDSKKTNYQIIKTFDLAEEKNIESAFSAVSKQIENTYFLYSTIGGFYGGKSVEDTDYNQWKKMLDINLNTAFLISKYFMKLVRGTNGGSICFTSAYSSFYPEAGKTAYNLSKSGLNYLVESLALEGSDLGISANAVAPFAIDTASNREWITDVSKLISPLIICDAVESLFTDYKKVNGNIIRLT